MRRFMMRIGTELAKEKTLTPSSQGTAWARWQPNNGKHLHHQRSDKHAHLQALIGMDKSEIVEIARRIGTYETSILPMMTAVLCLFENPPPAHGGASFGS